MALGALPPELAPGASGQIPLIENVARWAAEKPDAPSYTFVDYSTTPAGVRVTIDWGETYQRARAFAVRLRQAARPGERAALLLPQSLEFMMSMYGCMYSRVIAVPLFSPDLPGYADRLLRAYSDAEPAVVVTTRGALPHVEKFLADHDVPQPRELVFADEIDFSLGDEWEHEPIGLDELAYLQYTSGSTRSPAGVEVTHGNIFANAAQYLVEWSPTHPSPQLISWLPLFHDMGLVTAMATAMVRGYHATFIDPVAFVMNPMRWLQLISEHECTYTAAPNFAYDYLVSVATPEKLAGLDLSGLVSCLNGAEPIRTSTIRNFTETFASVGLNPGALSPCYGLAEATLMVAAAADPTPPKIITADRERLAAGELVVCDAGTDRAGELVSCGRPVGQYVAIVDPETSLEQVDGRVGEIWVHGPNVARGYWGKSERSQDTFAGVLAEPRISDAPAGPWLRTGDYGVIHERELYVTGRIKDLVIVDGRNHYPQDIEITAVEAHPAIRPDHVAAFALTGEETERLVVVAERNRRVPLRRLDIEEVENVVRSAVSVEHEMSVYDFLLVEPGNVARTTSGKIARAATKQRYLDGVFLTTRARLQAMT